MRDLMWRITAMTLELSLLALGMLADWRFRLRRLSTPPGKRRPDAGGELGSTAVTPR